MYKKVMALGMAMVMAAALPVSVLAKDTADGKLAKVAFICKGYSDNFCLKVQQEMEKSAVDYEDEFKVDYFDAETDAEKEVNLIQTCTDSGYDVIIFQETDAESSVSVVKEAVEKGIHVIVTTGQINDDGESHYINADPYQQGEVLVNYAIDEGYCDDAQIAILRGVGGNFHAESRYSAFTDALDKKEDAEVVAAEIANWTKNEAMTITQNWMVTYPDLDVIFASCDDMAFGAYEAVQMAGKEEQVKIFAIDGTDEGVQAVKDGIFLAEVQQNAKSYADDALEMASALLKGEEVENMNLESELITPENVDDFLK
ncbi:MAG: sugar ABC transporter substrate-binding protein [Eubacteriales bacterium]|nr:sugar ABC transporter substrate-binding protein [Eubacteriales bacterium]